MTFHAPIRDRHDEMASGILEGLTSRDEWPNVESILATCLRRNAEGHDSYYASNLGHSLAEYMSWMHPKPDAFAADWRAVCLDS